MIRRGQPTTKISEETLALSLFLEAMFRDDGATSAEETVSTAARVSSRALEGKGEHQQLPAWARRTFQTLLMDVGVLTLALPLTELGSVLPWPDRLATMPGQTSWILGVLPYRGRNVKVVDTASLIMPEGQSQSEVEPHQIVLIDNGNWGLACRSTSEVFKLDPADVRWRIQNRRRPWLAGTIIKRLSGLVDVKEFIKWLESGAK